MRYWTGLTVAVWLCCNPAIAMESKKFTCIERADWKTLDLEANGVHFNNFSFRSAPYFFDRDRLVANLTFSVTNRTADTVYVKAEFLFLDTDGDPLFVINAAPKADQVSAETTDTATGETFMEEGEFSNAGRVCYHIGGVSS